MSSPRILIALIVSVLPTRPAFPEEETSRAGESAGEGLVSTRIDDRIVKSFDFDERRLGNFESEPMNWIRIVDKGYPRFLEGSFDERVGHAAPPSFRLDLQGGSIGYHYHAKDIPVDPDSDYRIIAWIRPRGLIHAGARLTAYYLDHALRKIPGSQQDGQDVRGAGDDAPWVRIAIDLPGGFKRARWIGLSCRICQPPEPSAGASRFHPIHTRDVYGSAWFDDLRVMRLPRIELNLNRPIPLVGSDEPIVFGMTMHDRDGAGLEVDLDLLDAEGTTIHSRNLRGADLVRGSQSVDLGTWPAGLYRVRLTSRVGATEISSHERTFLRLNPDPSAGHAPDRPARESHVAGGATPAGRGFGVVADASLFDHPHLGAALFRQLSPEVVKVPIWRSALSDEAIVRGDARIDDMIDSLQRSGMRVVGVLESPPASLAAQYDRDDRSLWSILSSDPNRWRPYLALLLTRHGHRIRAWQVGSEEGPKTDDRSHRARAMAQVRAEMQPLIGRPALVLPCGLHHMLEAESLPAHVLSILIPSQFSADRLEDQLGGTGGDTFSARWATVESPPAERYQRRWRLIEFARRLITARGAGMETAFIRQPWTVDEINGTTVVTPAEEFILFRTLCRTLGGLTPAGSIGLETGVRAWLFKGPGDGRGALVVWTAAESAEDRPLRIDLNPEARQIDLWGNVHAGIPDPNGCLYPVNAMPTIITPVEPWRIEMLAGFSLDKPAFQPTVEEHERGLTLTNTRATRLIGHLKLEAPPGWRIRPRRLDVDLAPGRTARFPIRVRIPINQAAGDTTLIGRLETDEERLPDVTLQAKMQVSAPGLDVNVAAYRDGNRLHVVQRITNRSGDAMRLRAYVLAPDQARDLRMIRHLGAGQTAVRHYTLDGAARLSGRRIRVTVEQIDGPLRHNTLVNLE